jgi:hypothetical protein
MERDGPAASSDSPPAPSGVTLHLDRPDDLFSPPVFGEFSGSANLQSGIERLVAELKTSPRRGADVTVVIHDTAGDPNLQDRLRRAIRSYAAIRVGELEHQRAAHRRDGLSSLLVSVPVAVALSLLSVLVTKSDISEDWRTAIDGLVIVFLWVALWYPLDALLWYGRPLTQELRVVRRLEAATVRVRFLPA